MLEKILASNISSPITAVGNILDNLFTSDDERLSKELAMQRLHVNSQLVQSEINKIEAQHRSIFVAGWRPFLGWVSGSIIAYSYIVQDILNWCLLIYDQTLPQLPKVSPEGLAAANTLAAIMLGVYGTQRTIEKVKGKAK